MSDAMVIRRLRGAVSAYQMARAFECSAPKSLWLAMRYAATGRTGRYSIKLRPQSTSNKT